MPKVGSTAVDHTFRKVLGDKYSNLGPVVFSSIEAPWVKRAFVKNDLKKRDLLKESLVFSVIRNPFDLLVSKYLYGISYTNPWNAQMWGEKMHLLTHLLQILKSTLLTFANMKISHGIFMLKRNHCLFSYIMKMVNLPLTTV